MTRVGLLRAMLPMNVAVQERSDDADQSELYPAERQWISRAVGSRRSEFVTGRACARAALAELGQDPVALLPDTAGAPQWPDGFVGSITHCTGYRGAAVARAADFVSLGIDAELNAALPEGVLELVALPEERRALDLLPDAGVCWPRLLFSSKESVYKAWYPLTRTWLGFEQVRVRIDPAGETFRADLLVPGPLVGDRRLVGFDGRWTVSGGLLGTAVLESSKAG